MQDKNLDIYIGLKIMYIVGIIHTLFWYPVSSHIFKTLLLFEMPVIFFIIGASYSISKKKLYTIYSFKDTKDYYSLLYI